MASVSQKTLAWLYDVLRREYHDPNRTYSDIAQTLSRHPGLAPRTEVYTYENGAPALLLQLQGTIPVNFRGATYRFPVRLWIPHAYPHESPICYVTPTEDMVVRPGQHVSTDGRVYHHYLAHWRDTWERSNVVEFLLILADIFAKEPPVVARHQVPPPRPPPQSDAHPPLPPLPGRDGSSTPGRPPPNRAPAPPPKDFSSPSETNSTMSSRPGRYDAPPPLPPQSAAPGPSTPRYQSNEQYNSSQRPQTSSQQQFTGNRADLGMPMPPTPIPVTDSRSTYMHSQPMRQTPPQQLPHNRDTGRPPSYGSSMGVDSGPQSQQLPYRAPPQQPPSQHQTQAPSRYQQSIPMQQPQPQLQQQLQPQFIQNQHALQQTPRKAPEPNLLDSPFDVTLPSSTPDVNLPAPPIPRNPEKEALLSTLSSTLTQMLHQQLSQHSSSLNALNSQHSALVSTHSQLQAEISQLQNLHQTILSNVNILQSSLRDADKAIGSASARRAKGDVPPLDSSLLPPTIVGKQLYDTITDEKGIEAGIWALQEGFVRGRIGPEVWSRRTRELAREGFRKKYIARRIATGMGLDT